MENKKVSVGHICPDCQVNLKYLTQTKSIDSGVCGECDVYFIEICPQCGLMFSFWSDGVWDPPYKEEKGFETSEKDPEIVKKMTEAGHRHF